MKDSECHQMDLMTAFLNSKLDRHEIYIEMPHCYAKKSKVCELNRALYGLKHSPLLWFIRYTEYVKAMNYELLRSDPYLYINRSDKHNPVQRTQNISRRQLLISLYVQKSRITVNKNGQKANSVHVKLRPCCPYPDFGGSGEL